MRERTQELQAARAATERQRWQWEELFRAVPAGICIFDGPAWVYQFVNPSYQALFPGRALLGQRLVEALPEVADQPLMAILHRVYDTGESFQESEVLVPLARTEGGPVEDIYFDLTYLARRNEAGQIDGFITYAYDVTEQVLARRQADTLQASLLAAAQRQVQQREELFQVFEQAPAAIVLLREPDHRIEYVNPTYQQFFPGVALRGRLLGEAHPRAAATGVLARLDRVYQTGEPYVGEEQPVELTRTPGQPTQTHYFNFTYQPYREAVGIVGVSIFAYDVTEAALARRAAAEALERQRGELQRVFEQAPVAITILRGRELVIELANAAMSRLWGRPASYTVGRPHFEAIPETVGQGFEQLLLQVLDTGQPLNITEAPAQLDRGEAGQLEAAYVNFTFQPLTDEHGQTTGLVAVGTEVTEQVLARQRVEQLNQKLEAHVQERTREVREAQAATERERALLQALLTQAPVAIGLFQGEEMRITAANPLMAALWGYPPEQVLGRPFMEGVPELQGQGFDDLLRQVLHTRVPVTGTETPATMRRDGQLKTTYYNFVYQPLYNAEGEVLGVIDVAVEVTEQVEARHQVEQLNAELETRVRERTRQLREQQQLLRQILGQVPASIATLSGPEHRYTFCNELYQQLSANRTELGLTVAEVFSEVAAQGFIRLLDQVYATGEPFLGTDVPAQLYDAALGELRPYYVDFIYQPLFDDQRRVQGILAFILDVTDRAKARQQAQQSQLQVHELNQELAAINEELTVTNEELHQSNTRLLRTNHDLDTFVYTASHDLKAPITNIESILNALRETLPAAVQQDEVVAHLLGLLDHTVGRFRTTIDQLTDLTRLQQTYNEPAERLLLAPIVAGVLADLAPQVAAAAAQVQVDVPADLSVSFAPASLRSIVYNLLSNAVKYRAPERPAQVWLRAEPQPGQVVLSVRDNGLGLNESQQQRLFGVFQRLHTHVEGTGVGLYMIKRLIENAGARITVTSALGVGSTFTVTFPA